MRLFSYFIVCSFLVDRKALIKNVCFIAQCLVAKCTGLVLQLRAMSGSLTLLQLGSVFISVTRVTTKGHTGPWVGCGLPPETMLMSVAHAADRFILI